jgi:hypothetical protein
VSGINAAAMATHYGLLAPSQLDAALRPELDLERFVPDLRLLEGRGVASRLWYPLQDGRYMSETGLGEVEVDRRFSAAARAAFRSDPLGFGRACLLNLWNFASSFFERDAGIAGALYRIASLLLLLLACLGVGTRARREAAVLVVGSAGVVLVTAASMAVATLVYYRYRLPVAPLIAVLAALAAQALFDRSRRILGRERPA